MSPFPTFDSGESCDADLELGEQTGRERFAQRFGSPGTRRDAANVAWCLDRSSYHGREALQIVGNALPVGMHWDVSSERCRTELRTTHEVWDIKGTQYLNVAPDMFVRAAPKKGKGGAGAELIALRDDINPDGLEAVNKTYRAESGQTAQLEARLPRLLARLQSIQVGPKPGKSLGEYVNESIANGRKLGELEDEKGRLQAAPVDATGAEWVNARNAWIRVANARMANLDESKMATIFGPLWAAEQVADRRGTSKPKKDAKPDPTGGGTPV